MQKKKQKEEKWKTVVFHVPSNQMKKTEQRKRPKKKKEKKKKKKRISKAKMGVKWGKMKKERKIQRFVTWGEFLMTLAKGTEARKSGLRQTTRG